MSKTGDPETDIALLDAWRRGDSRAGSRLVARHFPSLYRFFSTKVGNGNDVDDLIQSTVMRLVSRRDDFDERVRFRSWLFGIAYNVIHEYYRRAAMKGRVDNIEDLELADPGDKPDELLEGVESRHRLLRALRSLSVDEQVIIELYYWERMTLAEISEILGLNMNTVAGRIRRARKRLAEIL